MAKNAFLTDRRREFLEGDYDLKKSKDRHLKVSLEESAETALKELVEVAASPEIENADVFEPNTLARLVDALMVPTGSSLTPRWNFDGDPTEFRDKYQYQLALHSRLDHCLDGYQEMLHRDYHPSETPTFGDVLDIDADDL